jgi:uncharacterized protein YbjT (DUF2867 family)
MIQKKIITVFGATGAQGGGVARAILKDAGSEFTVRAVTRDTGSEKAKALAAMGAEVVSGDIDDQASIEHVLEGAYGAFFVTFYWAHMNPEKEIAQVKNMANAAKKAGLKHAIWSTLEDTREFYPLSDDRMPTLLGNYKVPHFDSKGGSDHFFTDLGVPVTILRTTFFWDNFLYFGLGPKKGQDGKLAITFPMGDKKLPGIAAEDIGKAAYAIFKRGSEFVGKTIGIAGGQPTCQEMADGMAKRLGLEIHYNEISPEIYRGFGFPGAEDMGNMFQFYRDCNDYFTKSRDVEFTRKLDPSIKTFEMWLNENAAKLASTI